MQNIDVPVAVTLIAVGVLTILTIVVANVLSERRARRRRRTHARLQQQAAARRFEPWDSIERAGIADSTWDAETQKALAKEEG